MRLVFVMDDLSHQKNGTTMTAVRYADELRRRGHEVRMVGYGAAGPDAFAVPKHSYPVVDYFTSAQDFVFAEPDDATIAQALDGADIAHLFLPFKLERAVMEAARARHIPVSAAFHLQPENMTYNAHLAHVPAAADAIYRFFRDSFYDKVRHVHCPSLLVAHDLEANHGYHAQMHAISNGVGPQFTPGVSRHPFNDGLFHIVTVGRLSPEKSQHTLLEAVALSVHADRIQVHIAGRGPLEAELRERGSRLPHPPQIGFFEGEALVDLLRAGDLYVHASVIDSEAISCIEAFSCGLVPVISVAPLSATHQFALDGRSLFPVGDPQALAERIDYWIEHPDERAVASQAYLKEAQRYTLASCVEQFIAMEEQAIADDQADYAMLARAQAQEEAARQALVHDRAFERRAS